MSEETRSDRCAGCLARLPERLVVMGLRGWIAGYETGDIACWETVWNDYARELGVQHAKPVVTELGSLVRTLRREAVRPLACYPSPCRFLCRDECMALGLIAGCQAEEWQAAKAAAHALAGEHGARAVVESGCSYAGALENVGQRLKPVPLSSLALFEGRPYPQPLH